MKINKHDILKAATLGALLGIALGIVYGFAFLAKHISYNLWYEDLVVETVLEMKKKGEI